MLRSSSLTQKQIAKRLDISEAATSKFVAKLELYGYVKRTRSKEGSGWNVSLV
jgi:DNA-binding MarR family transcriptional regulator